MSQATKFRFDQNFSDRVTRSASIGRRYTEAELAACRDEAFAKGVTEGHVQAEAEAKKLAAEALSTIATQMHALLDAHARAIETSANDAAELAVEVGRKFARALMEAQPMAEIEDLIVQCVGRIHGEPRVAIRVNAGLLDILRERIDALAEQSGFAGKLVLLGDDAIPASDCRIEWADGGAERDIARLGEDIDATIERLAAARGAETAAPWATIAETESDGPAAADSKI